MPAVVVMARLAALRVGHATPMWCRGSG